MEGHEANLRADAYPQYLKRGMGREEVEKNIREALDGLPGCVGMNNHMGSLASTDRALMDEVCGALKSRGLFFLDSRTSGKTVAETEAARLGLPHGRRDVFLDDVETPQAILAQMDKLVLRANKKGVVVGIGHFKLTTLRTLEQAVHQLKEQGIQFVYLSEVVKE
jgi:polysaccharide deacetylase 2 family uncharacterized protein YibQ